MTSAVPDHNSPRWLTVRYLPKTLSRHGKRWPAGWYVVRTCPCHWGCRVTMPLPTSGQANRTLRLLVRASTVLGT